MIIVLVEILGRTNIKHVQLPHANMVVDPRMIIAGGIDWYNKLSFSVNGTTLIIHPSVTTIKEQAFLSCKSLKALPKG